MYKFFLLVLLVPSILAAQRKPITLNDIKNNEFKQDYVAGFTSMQDGNFYCEENAAGDLQKIDFKTGDQKTFICNLKNIKYNGKDLSIDNYEFNADETKLLLFTESENIYRRSILAKVYIYDIQSKEVIKIAEDKILHASFSPNNDKVAFVQDNNLFYIDLNTLQTIQITFDGEKNKIINGNCDWVYEEEFEFTKAFEWDNTGTYIAYYRFDETLVPEYNFAIYDHLYPTDYRYKYPKAGEKNSSVKIGIYNLFNKEIQFTNYDSTIEYIPRIKWSNQNTLYAYTLNRHQDDWRIDSWDPNHFKKVNVFSQQQKSYIEINDNIKFLKKADAFVYTSEADGYNHLYYFDVRNNSAIQLTKGKFEVVDVCGFNDDETIVYYTSTELSPIERNVYCINMKTLEKKIITPEIGWHDVTFSNGMHYFLDKYSYINTLPKYTIKNNKGEVVRTLKDNQSLKNKLTNYDISNIELIKVPNEVGDSLYGWILKPNNFDASNKYPLLMFQYSGPGSQEVKNQFLSRDIWWYQMLAQKGYIILCVDGRGTGFRGEAFKKCTYLNLGKYESDDQIAVAKYFANQTYIDKNRIGIWGWSYGGFMSSTCIMKGADIFKMAIAVAPVTNWRYYDNIYTERYMRTPQENPNGYDDNSPTNMVSNLKGKFLLIHGTADDNVHYQNSMMLVDKLIQANKEFDSEMYPNKHHGISGGNTRNHLYQRLTKYILENL